MNVSFITFLARGNFCNLQCRSSLPTMLVIILLIKTSMPCVIGIQLINSNVIFLRESK